MSRPRAGVYPRAVYAGVSMLQGARREARPRKPRRMEDPRSEERTSGEVRRGGGRYSDRKGFLATEQGKAKGLRRRVKDGELSAAAALAWLRVQDWSRPAFVAWLRRKAGQE